MYATINRLHFERFNYKWAAIHAADQLEKIPPSSQLKK